MGGSYGLPMEQFDEEEEGYEEENPNNILTGGGDPMAVQMDAVEGMENNEEEEDDSRIVGPVPPQAYISEEFASY
jgi:hypothetical protein